VARASLPFLRAILGAAILYAAALQSFITAAAGPYPAGGEAGICAPASASKHDGVPVGPAGTACCLALCAAPLLPVPEARAVVPARKASIVAWRPVATADAPPRRARTASARGPPPA